MNDGKVSRRVAKVLPFYVMDLMAKAKALEAQGRDVVHMEVGEPDFSTPKPILQAATEFLAQGDVHYTQAQGLLALREKIAQFYFTTYRVSVPVERIFITPGASGALTVALATLLDEGDEVLIPAPGYPCNNNLISLLSAEAKTVDVFAEDNFQFTADSIAKAWGDATRGVMIASPSNPTGMMIAREQLSVLIKQVQQREGFFISDEIYHGLSYAEPAVSALEFSDDVFVLNSFSKYFGMTGWRLGWLIVPEYAIAAANRLMQNMYISAATHSQYAALAAFDEVTLDILQQRRDEFKRRRDVLYDGLAALGFKMNARPQGAFYIYVDCSEFCEDSYSFALELLEHSALAITPGLDFGANQPESYLRFAYTTSIERIELGLQRLKEFLAIKQAV
ncbi:MAG: aminotransferase class I/II-fold pyridoxal phosphate-dependent enzyme [Cycloclasticus sp.]|nr:aminotransferase [Cycloclasticus sp. 46_83_sub15_T18]